MLRSGNLVQAMVKCFITLAVLLCSCTENGVLGSKNKRFPDPGELGGDCFLDETCADKNAECNIETKKCVCEVGYVARVLDTSFVGEMGFSACFVQDKGKCVPGLLEAAIPEAKFLPNRAEYTKLLDASKKKLSTFMNSQTDETTGEKLTDQNKIASLLERYEGEVKSLEKLDKDGLIGLPSKVYSCASGVCTDGVCGEGNQMSLFDLGQEGTGPRNRKRLVSNASGNDRFATGVVLSILYMIAWFFIMKLIRNCSCYRH